MLLEMFSLSAIRLRQSLTSKAHGQEWKANYNPGSSGDLTICQTAFSVVSSITPGPNNLMLLASGVNYGFVRSVPIRSESPSAFSRCCSPVFVKVDPDTVRLEPGFTLDVRNIGHFGTGDLEIVITDAATLAVPSR